MGKIINKRLEVKKKKKERFNMTGQMLIWKKRFAGIFTYHREGYHFENVK